jgi:hypothetical protein
MTLNINIRPSARLVILVALFLFISQWSVAQQRRYYRKFYKNPSYFGFAIVPGMQQHRVSSDFKQMNKERVSFYGSDVAVLKGNMYGMVRVNGGLFYSDPSASKSIDIWQLGISGSLYLLRIGQIQMKAHTFEPYVLGGLMRQRANFFGRKPTLDGAVSKNASIASEERIGSTSWTQAYAGLGAEYQMTNEANQFLSFFAEARMGMTFMRTAQNDVLKDTILEWPVSFRVGIAFGVMR